MPRRKRTSPQNEGRRKVRRTDDNDEDTLVISDSENEEEEDSVTKMSTREARWRGRENRSHMEDMTEEEMLDLAMRLSKQEANSAAHRQQLEDDDMKKAIAESLHVSQTNTESDSSTSKLSQDPATVPTNLRRKLSFPSESETDRASDDDVAAVAGSDEDSKQDLRPLPQMPDLSQRTLSQLSPPSPALPPVPSTASQECQFSQVDSPMDKLSQSNSQTQFSPAFLRQCSVRLTQHPMSTNGASRNPLILQENSFSFTSPGRSQLTQQQSPSPPKSPVFVKTDPKREPPEDNLTDTVCTPKEEIEESAICQNQLYGSSNPRKRLSLSRKGIPGPDDDDVLKKEAVQPDQLNDDSSQGTSLNAMQEKVPNSEKVPLPADNKSLEEFTSHMVLHLSDDDYDEEEEEKVVSASPVFHQEFVPHAENPRLSPTQPCCSPSIAIISQDRSRTLSHSTEDSDSHHVCIPSKVTSKTAYPAESDQLELNVQKTACDSRPTHLTEGKGNNFVSYYWGVPFCPRGQSPDDYTKVILSQFEVYEKSLKEAQHRLLHKAEWGLPLLPCPSERAFGRRMKRHRAPQLLEEEEEEPEKEEGEKKKEVEEEREERAKSWVGSEEGAANGQNETYVVVSSPETQEELVEKSPLLFRRHESTDTVKPSSYRKSSPQDLSEDTQIQQPDEHEEGQNENNMESTVCPETQMTEDNTPELMVTSPAQPQSRAGSEMMEVDEEAAVDEDRMEQDQDQEQSQTVECPMCTRHFPLSKIEVHAAYCDGTTEDQVQQDDNSQAVTLRKRTRKIAMEATLSRSENRSEQQEKCYLCQNFFPSKEYSRHVDKCLPKELRSNQGNGLLSALHRAEKVNLDDDDDGAGPSDRIRNHGSLADTSVVDEAVGNRDSQASGVYDGSSPIKSFTPISEATDCLIDFQRQYSARPSQRLGRKRKFKR